MTKHFRLSRKHSVNRKSPGEHLRKKAHHCASVHDEIGGKAGTWAVKSGPTTTCSVSPHITKPMANAARLGSLTSGDIELPGANNC
jgi:hypothetical protein